MMKNFRYLPDFVLAIFQQQVFLAAFLKFIVEKCFDYNQSKIKTEKYKNELSINNFTWDTFFFTK
jgi:hypothetical protein